MSGYSRIHPPEKTMCGQHIKIKKKKYSRRLQLLQTSDVQMFTAQTSKLKKKEKKELPVMNASHPGK